MPLQVIWAIGASMVVLAGAQFLGARACLAIGTAIVVGHNALDPIWPVSHAGELGHPLWVAAHAQMAMNAGPLSDRVRLSAAAVDRGVMLCGFGIAGVFRLPPQRRDALLLRGGLALTLAFIVLRALALYGDPHPWQGLTGQVGSTLMSFLNTEKYPPSLLYLLMTLGPAAILCSFAERFHGPLQRTLVMFGTVPFAFYVAHLYLIHLLSIALGVAQGFDVHAFLTMGRFYPKTGYGLPLAGVYAVWALVVALLYPPVPMGCERQGASQGLVAELSLGSGSARPWIGFAFFAHRRSRPMAGFSDRKRQDTVLLRATAQRSEPLPCSANG